MPGLVKPWPESNATIWTPRIPRRQSTGSKRCKLSVLRRQNSHWRDYNNEGQAGNSSNGSQSGGGNNGQEEDFRDANSEDEDASERHGWWDDWSAWRGGRWSSQSNYTSDKADWVETTDELLPDVLQGWYLLADANLDTPERNLIQTAVAGDFSLERTAQELRSQFPEMGLMRRDQQHKPSSFCQTESDAEDECAKEPHDAANLV